jgi:hypothetical protein
MPKQRFERHEPTHDWHQLRPLLKDPTQLTYEIIRPVVLGWETPKERSAETGMPQRTIYYKANLFDQAGMASLLPPDPPPAVPKLDKRSLPPPMRQAIVDLKAEYPPFTLHEIATICYKPTHDILYSCCYYSLQQNLVFWTGLMAPQANFSLWQCQFYCNESYKDVSTMS